MKESALKYTIGIWGCGVVGDTTSKLFEKRAADKVEILKYDRYKEGEWVSTKNLTENSDFIFICLPTPMGKDGEIDLSYIDSAMSEISKYVSPKNNAYPGKIVIIRSTIVPGSADYFAGKYPLLNIVVMPEFLTEANPLEDILGMNRIVIGTPDRITYLSVETLFQNVYEGIDFIPMKRDEAEMYKYACNYFLSMNAMAANELERICQTVGVDYGLIQRNLHYDPRIGSHTKVPGPDGFMGIGGKCLPKDFNALAHLAKTKGYTPALIDAAIDLNERIRENKDWLNIKGAVSDCKFEEDDK